MDPHVAAIAAVACGIGYLMTLSGLSKNMLELRRPRRTCPACGRRRAARRCHCAR